MLCAFFAFSAKTKKTRFYVFVVLSFCQTLCARKTKNVKICSVSYVIMLLFKKLIGAAYDAHKLFFCFLFFEFLQSSKKDGFLEKIIFFWDFQKLKNVKSRLFTFLMHITLGKMTKTQKKGFYVLRFCAHKPWSCKKCVLYIFREK